MVFDPVALFEATAMTSKRMSLVGAGVAVLVPLLGAWEASAQGWKPDKPVEIVIGTRPGRAAGPYGPDNPENSAGAEARHYAG